MIGLLAHTTIDLFYAVPLILAISCVYAATRQENPHAIVRRALRVGTLIVVFMAAILALLTWASSGL